MMNAVIQIVSAIFGTFGFCLIFHVEKKHIWMPALGGGVCWGAYLLFIRLGLSVFFATFFASALIGLLGEIFAHSFKMPTTVYFIPACVPLIPGSNLYYMLMGMLAQDWVKAKTQFTLLVLYAVGIAAGLAVVLELEHIRRSIVLKLKKC